MTSDNTKPWLRAEIAQWLREGIISDEQAQRLLERYPSTPEPVEYGGGKGVFASLGVLVFGMGIMLLFAYNWAEMHRYAKLGSIFFGVVLSHGLAALIKDPRVSSSLHLLGTMLFGAGIWLIAQVYHFSAHYPDGFLLWAMAALLMAWVLPSLSQCLLGCALLTLWSAVEVLEFNALHFWALAVLLLLQLPWAYWQRSPLALTVVLMLLALALLVNSWHLQEGAALLHACLLAAMYLCAEHFSPRMSWSGCGSVFRRVGLPLWLALMLIFSFADAADIVVQLDGQAGAAAPLTWSMLFVLGAAWLWVLLDKSLRPRSPMQIAECALLLLPLLVLAAISGGVHKVGMIMTAANLSVLAYGVLFIVRGTSSLDRRQLVLGCGLIVLLVGLRFTDLFESLLARAGVFLLLGVLLFLAGLRYSRQKQRRLQEQRHV